MQVGIMGDEALGKHPHQHRHTQERAGDLDQRKPFSVVTCGGHGARLLRYTPVVALRKTPYL